MITIPIDVNGTQRAKIDALMLGREGETFFAVTTPVGGAPLLLVLARSDAIGMVERGIFGPSYTTAPDPVPDAPPAPKPVPVSTGARASVPVRVRDGVADSEVR